MEKSYKSAWEIFTDPVELKIAERIQNLRYVMLIHSCIYYKLNDSIMDDYRWNELAHELADLQNKYQLISEKVTLYEYFEDWDGSTGAFLPLNLDWVVKKARNAIERKHHTSPIILPTNKKVAVKPVKKKRLF